MANQQTTVRPTPTGGGAREFWRDLWTILRQRCPRCRKGRMFRGILTINDPCPVCGLLFQREEGSFLGAMYVSYALSAAITAVCYFALAALLPGWNGIALASLAILAYLPFVPAVFRYSRVLWVYYDRVGDYSDLLAGPYEKYRLWQLAKHKDDPPSGENHCTRPPVG
jgi:uncharacterized protein (DUF983 family)